MGRRDIAPTTVSDRVAINQQVTASRGQVDQCAGLGSVLKVLPTIKERVERVDGPIGEHSG